MKLIRIALLGVVFALFAGGCGDEGESCLAREYAAIAGS